MRFIILYITILFCSFNVYGQVINAGVSGNSTTELIARIEKDAISLQPDLTIVMVGTNDRLNSKKMISYQEYAENLSLIVKTLKSEKSKVLLMSPPPVDSVYLFTRHDRNLFSQAPNEIMDSVSRIVEKVADTNDVFFLNIFDKFNSLNLPKHNEDLFFRNQKNCGVKDGVHPTALGYHFIAANIFQFLKENKLLTSNMKIVCLGDSITYGAGANGGGSVTGENYPSFLSFIIVEMKEKEIQN